MGQRPRISALPLRIQKADSRKLQQAPRLGATGRSRGRARQEARLRIWLRDGPRCACCGGNHVAGFGVEVETFARVGEDTTYPDLPETAEALQRLKDGA